MSPSTNPDHRHAEACSRLVVAIESLVAWAWLRRARAIKQPHAETTTSSLDRSIDRIQAALSGRPSSNPLIVNHGERTYVLTCVHLTSSYRRPPPVISSEHGREDRRSFMATPKSKNSRNMAQVARLTSTEPGPKPSQTGAQQKGLFN